MRFQRWQVQLTTALILLTAVFYTIRWLLFPTPGLQNEMIRFLIGDIAFLFLQVLLVTVVIDGVIRKRQRDEMREKLNMLVGAFFIQSGTGLLGLLAEVDADLATVRDQLVPRPDWASAEFRRARELFSAHDAALDLTGERLIALRAFLARQRDYLLSLISNESLLEHQSFTDLLWAITHVSEELDARNDLSRLGPADLAHLNTDLKRAYSLLGATWISYLEHLKMNYPHLFSLAARTNPLDPDAHAEIDS